MRTVSALLIMAGAAFLAADISAADPVSEVGDNQLRLQTMTAEDQAQLRQNARYFLTLSSERRERIVKLDHELQDLSQPRREKLEKVLSRYAEWLEQLPAEDREKVQGASDAKNRIEIIRHLRAEQWLKQQPVAVRNDLARLSAEQRFGRIRQLRDEERNRRFDWVIARRFWSEISDQKPLPARLQDFTGRDFDDLATYVKDYLHMTLSNEEKARLKNAEGKWPLYPKTLVQLADAHPLALPGTRGPTHYMELPAEVRRRLGKNKKDPVATFLLRMKEGRWPNFAINVTQYAAGRRGKQGQGMTFPFELWPYDARGLSPRMRQFIEKELRPVLDDDEAARLRKVELAHRWPDFPETIQRFASKHDLIVPWQSLPGPEEYWDRFRPTPRLAANR
ncbi:MAG: hypothetical protein FJ271_11340 [Planctomycetes bacterium]|nr:hypothetical protein [Planctomycetota bacterium]